jgi:apolipoprotein D and lipocalin family protein
MRLLSILFTLFAASAAQTVPELDTQKYLGRWYQVYADLAVYATFENSTFCDTADYGLNTNGTISVLNRERQFSPQGSERPIYGWANTPNASEPGQLTVHLETTEFPAPYWVYELGPATYNGSLYEYAVVSDPFKLTLFVLARNLTTFAEEWEAGVLQRLNTAGFTGFLNTPIATKQGGCTYWE